MEATQNPISPVRELLKNEQIQSIASGITPRLSHLVSTLANIGTDPEKYSQQQQKAIEEAFKSIVYQKQVGSGSLCRTYDKNLKYYRCYTCTLIKGACICQLCFTKNHENHQFKIFEKGSGYCDCGNSQNLKSQFFCKEHANKDKQVKSKLPKKEIDIFNKEIQFMLYICLKAKEVSNSSNQSDILSFRVFSILSEICLNSYTYQQITSQIFLRHFSKQYRIEQQAENIFQIYLWAEWTHQDFLKQFAALLCHLYSCQKMRKRILVEYFHLHTSQNKFVIWVNPITGIDVQYFLQGRLILKYLKSGKIPPLTLNYKFKTIHSTADCFLQIYRAYSIMSITPQFPQILQESLKKIHFRTFFCFGIIDRESRASITIVTRSFLKFLQLIVCTVQKMKNERQIFQKIIRQSYEYIKTKEEIYNFCPERMLLSSVFSIYGYDLTNIANLTTTDILQLFQQNTQVALKETLQKMLQSYFNLFRIENFNDYRDLTTDKKYDLNTRNFIVAALDFTCVRILITMTQIVIREPLAQLLPLKSTIIGKNCMIQKWFHLYRVEKTKKQSIVDPQAKNQITTLMETGLFVKVDDQIASTAIQFVAVVNNLLFACESSLCQIVLANHFKRPSKEKIFKIYSECAWLSPQRPKLQFKGIIENLIDNQQLIKCFITTEYQGYFKGDKSQGQRYQSNLSYCSRFFNDQVTEDTTQRFKKKLQSNERQQQLTRLIFTQDLITKIVKFTKYFIKSLIFNQIKLDQAASINITLNLLIQCIIVVYTETKSQKLEALIHQINSNTVLAQNYTDYSKIVVGVLFQYFKKKNEQIVEEVPSRSKKEEARLKRDLKMKQIKEKQSKFLQQHSMQYQKLQQSEDLCIICKRSSSSEHKLNYLCRIRFINTFNRNILKNNDNMMVITTCRHKIHQKCLAQNQKNQYDMNYSCFLCKEISNLRLPLNIGNTNIDGYLQYFLTVISLQLNANHNLKHLIKEYTSAHRLCKLLYDSIVLSIYFYYLTLGKFYTSYIVPIFQEELSLLRWLIKLSSAPKSVYSNNTNNTLKIIEEKVNELISNNRVQASNSSVFVGEGQKTQLQILFSKILKSKQYSSPEINQIQRFNFYKVPQDLCGLRAQIGTCINCNKMNNKIVICFLCGFKNCSDCNIHMNTHLENHLGTSVLIEAQTGRYCYRFRNLQVSYISLYINYIGEQFQDENKLPPKGEYKLSRQRYEKLIDQILKDCIQNTVQKYFRQAQQLSVPACNVQ